MVVAKIPRVPPGPSKILSKGVLYRLVFLDFVSFACRRLAVTAIDRSNAVATWPRLGIYP